MRDGSNNLVGWLALLGILVFVIISWQFKELLGLRSPEASMQIILNYIILFILIGVSVFFGGDLAGPGRLWPVFLAIGWACFWPALNDWADQSYPTFLGEAYAPWWNAWYTKLGILAGIIALGYTFKKWRDDY